MTEETRAELYKNIGTLERARHSEKAIVYALLGIMEELSRIASLMELQEEAKNIKEERES